MAIDTETAARVAKLARIKVEDSDLPALAGEFNAILGFIEQLNEVVMDVEFFVRILKLGGNICGKKEGIRKEVGLFSKIFDTRL